MNIVCIAEEDDHKPLVGSTVYLTGLTAPTNESATTVIVWSSPTNDGTSPSSLGQMYGGGQRFEKGAQIQLQPTGENQIDLSYYHVTVQPGMAPAQNATMGAADKLVTTVDGSPLVAHFLSATFTQPAVNSTVDVTLIDSSDFSGVANGTRILIDGCLYTIDTGNSTFTTSGTLRLTNLGLGGARIALTA